MLENPHILGHIREAHVTRLAGTHDLRRQRVSRRSATASIRCQLCSRNQSGLLFKARDPNTSVVNLYGQIRDTRMRFIVGGSTFSSMRGASNPTLTIYALAHITADAFGKRYKNKPGPLQ
jgi:choline dehydrogenase-like flavoprotein